MRANKSISATEIKVLQDGKRDARTLLILWFIRRLFWPLILLGIIGHILNEDIGNSKLDLTNFENVAAKLLSPLIGLGLALFIKLTTSYIAIFISYPLLRERQKTIKDERYGWFLSRWMDRYRILKGFSEIRWTHHIRQEALERVKNDVIKWSSFDKYLDVLTIALIVFSFLLLIALNN